MKVSGRAVVMAALAAAAVSLPASAQDTPARASNPGRELVTGKCFQCHTDSMFRDGRMDRIGWEASIYRMGGGGEQGPAEETKERADSPGAVLGPNKPVAAQSQ